MTTAASPSAALVALLLFATATQGAFVGGPGACFSACRLPLEFISFADIDGPSTWSHKIASHDFMTSLVACMSTYCSPEGINAGWDRFASMRDLGAPGTPLPAFADVLAVVPADPLVVDTLAHQGDMYNRTILVSRSNFDDGFHTDVSSLRFSADGRWASRANWTCTTSSAGACMPCCQE